MKSLFHIAAAIGVLTFGGVSISLANTALSDMPAGAYTLDKTHASLVWKVSHLGLSNYTARFTDFDANIDFDPANVTNSSVMVTVNPMSIETDYPGEKDFNGKLKSGKKWFNAGTYPKITYQSTGFEQTGETKGILTGDLNFLGQKHPLDLNVTFNKAMLMQPFAKKPAMGFSASGTLKRSDWGMNSYIPSIGDEVELVIEAEFVKGE